MKKIIPITTPNIEKDDYISVLNACKNEWKEKCFDSIKKLEKNFSKKFKYKYSKATSSCTGALHLALLALNINKGDELSYDYGFAFDQDFKQFPCKCGSKNCIGYIIREGSRWRVKKIKRRK